MMDLIERQAAIDTLDKHLRTTDVPVSYPGIISALTEWLNELPSAQADSKETSSTHKALDTISRQAAIDVLDVLCQEHRYRIPGKSETYRPYNEAWQDALGRAECAIGKLPSVQPVDKDINVSCKDVISRRGAIDAVDKLSDKPIDYLESAIDVLVDLPSVQPDIIHCKDCKHWREGTAFSYCDKLHGMGVLDALDYMTAEDDYCSMAERRTDETD